MNTKELFDNHCVKSAAHHDALAKCHRKVAKAHGAIASAHADQTVAQGHRDLAAHHSAIAAHHESQQEHFEALRESLSAGAGADVMDNHENETRNLQNIYRPSHIDHLRAMRLLPAD